MKIGRFRLLVVMGLLGASPLAHAASTVNPFLYDAAKGGVSIRALGMGGAFTAVADETAALSYNPAGLGVPGSSFRTENLDFSQSVSSAFGANYAYLSPFGIGRWTKSDAAYNADVTAIGFGRQGRGVDWGIVYKSMQASSQAERQSGWSVDFGVIARLAPFMDFGIVAQDILKRDVDLPVTGRAGVAFFTPMKDFLLSLDAQLDRKGSDEIHFVGGAEWMLTDGIRVRGGLNRDRVTGGLSISLPIFEIDYGFSSQQSGGDDPIYALGFRFGRGVTPTSPKRQRYALFKPETVAEFSIASNLVEGKSEFALLNGFKVGSNDLVALIRMASEDSTCQGFVIRVAGIPGDIVSIGMIQEIRSELLKAKQAGKRVLVYLDGTAGMPEYYLATIADEIVMPEMAAIGQLGLRLDVVKTKYFLSNFGINDTVIQSGRYKAATFPNTPELTDPEYELMADAVNDLYRQLLVDIRKDRRLDWSKVSAYFDGRMMTASEAKRIGLIDRVGYVTDSAEAMTRMVGKRVDVAPLESYEVIPDSPTIFSATNRIAVLEVDGEIVNGLVGVDMLQGTKKTGAADIEQRALEIVKDPTIRGVVLRVNSPGGSVLGSDRILNAVQLIQQSGRPVYASLGNVAASGGYYVAMGADRIYANPATLTGSIGVVSIFRNITELNDLLDIRHRVIKTGRYMGVTDVTHRPSTDDIKMIAAYQNQIYVAFKSKLKQFRKLTDSEVNQLAQGQLILGESAQRLKIVDELGNFYTTVDDLAKKQNIQSPELVFYRQKPAFLSQLVRLLSGGMM